MNAFIEHTTSTGRTFIMDPERVSLIDIAESTVTIYTNPMMFMFGLSVANGTKEDGLEIMQKILDWRNAQFDRAEKLKNMLAEDPELEPGSEPA